MSLADSVPAGASATPSQAASSHIPFGSKALARMFAAFAYRYFRVQWIGACTSSIGTWTQAAAQNWMITTLTAGAGMLKVISGAGISTEMIGAGWWTVIVGCPCWTVTSEGGCWTVISGAGCSTMMFGDPPFTVMLPSCEASVPVPLSAVCVG